MKVGLIGAGYWGKKQVEEYFNLGVKLTVADLKKENLKYCKEKFKVKVTTDYKDILADKNIEAISICTPNDTHFQICKDCLKHGKNVLVEKPLASTVEQGKELVKLAEKNKLILVVGHIYRFNNAIRKIKEMFDNGEFGKVYIIKLRWANLQPFFEDRDVISDLVPHPFDIINYLFNRDPDEVSCVGNAYRRKDGVEAVFVNCRLDSTIINVELSWITPQKDRSLVIVGSKKSAFVDCLSQKISVYENDTGRSIKLPITPNNTIQDELNNFLTCVKNQNISIANGEVGVKVLKMIETVRRSLIEKRTLHFDVYGKSFI